MSALGQTVVLEEKLGQTPGTVTVDLDMLNFTDVGAFSFYIQYDDALLTYTGPSAVAFQDANITINDNYGGNAILALNWNKVAGVTINGTVLSLEFDYKGGFNGGFTFVQPPFVESEVVNSSFGIIINFKTVPFPFTHGSISPDLGDPDGIATLGDATGIVGATVLVPLSITDDGGFNGEASALTFKIGYDTEKLTYDGVSDNTLSMTVGEADGVITLVKNNEGTPFSFPLTDPVINLNFVYLGGGIAEVNFQSGSLVSDDAGNTLITTFVNGSVDLELPSGAGTLSIAKISSVQADSVALPDPPGAYLVIPVEVELPITADGLSATAAGSIALKIGYDADLVYTGFSSVNFPTGWTITQSTGMVSFSRANAGGITIADGVLLTLEFDYTKGLAEVNFLIGTQLDDVIGDPIPVGLEDGWVTPPIYVNTKVFLQGPYKTVLQLMDTSLLRKDLIPLEQPYSDAPWAYTGTESVVTVPNGVVDWILVELRTGTEASTAVAQRAGFLLKNGCVVDTDGTSLLAFVDGLEAGDYHIMVTHRNHLAIMSSMFTTLNSTSTLYDFTDAKAKSYTNPSYGFDPVIDLTDGNWGMYGGDGTADERILFGDFGVFRSGLNTSPNMYMAGDYNMDANILFGDFPYFKNNVNKRSHVPL